MIKSKRGLVWNEISWWVIGLAVLAIVIIFLFVLGKGGFALIDKITEFLRFGR